MAEDVRKRGLKLYADALAKLNEIYVSGTMEYLEKHDNDLNDRINQFSLVSIEKKFKEYLVGSIEFFDLRNVLGEWYHLMESAIKRYKASRYYKDGK